MRPLLTLTVLSTGLLLASGTGAARAYCPIEQLPYMQVAGLCGGGGGGGGYEPPPRQCTAAIPIPADAFDVQCKTLGLNPAARCQEALPQAQCASMISSAYSQGLITGDAVSFLTNNGFCPIVIDLGSGPRIHTFCPAGCFAGGTQILTGDVQGGESGYLPASEVTLHSTLMSVLDGTTPRDLALTPIPIKRVVHGPEKPELYVFTLASGAALRVTMHHPMILASGKIVAASEVERGASFVGVDGRPVAVTEITREPAIGDVFNFETVGDTQLSHVIVAEGVLVGDLKLQNELATEEASIQLRR